MHNKLSNYIQLKPFKSQLATVIFSKLCIQIHLKCFFDENSIVFSFLFNTRKPTNERNPTALGTARMLTERMLTERRASRSRLGSHQQVL